MTLLLSVCFFLCLAISVFGVTRFETCKVSSTLKSSPFCQTSLTHEARVAYLIKQLTLEEKISFLDTGTWEAGIPRVELSPFNWGQEGLHGLASCNFTTWKVTSFPQVINLGRTFDVELWKEMSTAISDEARALSNTLAVDLSFWAPNLNIFRDPRWGRGQETPGEDPYLTSTYANAYVSGLQFGSDSRYLKAISGTKHYTAYDLENWGGRTRHQFNAEVSALDMEETFQPPFHSAVKTGVKQIMCSYNEINGVPSCGNEEYLQTELRDSWGFDGSVVSDCGAVRDIEDSHDYTSVPEQAVALAMMAGTDLDCGGYYASWALMAVKLGYLNESIVDLAASRLLLNRMRLGEFDDWSDQPYRKIPTSVIASKAHTDLGYKLTQESMLMLKNLDDTLPLDPSSVPVVAVLGPNAKATTMLQGDYSGPAPYIISPYDGIADVVSQALYAEGCTVKGLSKKGFKEAIGLATQADAVILVMGYDHWCERESQDRFELTLTGVQKDFIEEVADALKGSKPLIVVSINGGPIDYSWLRDNPAIHGLILAGYPSMAAGKAIADVIFGKISPSGRAVMTTYPKDYVNQVSMWTMAMRPIEGSSPGRSYKFYTGTPVYQFGEGLSFTSFKYDWYDPSPTIPFSKSEMEKYLNMPGYRDVNLQYLAVNVTNTGTKWIADDVVLGFITNTNRDHPALVGASPPIKQLFAFERARDIKPGETRTVKFGVSPISLSSVTAGGKRVIVEGDYVVSVGICGANAVTSTNCVQKRVSVM